MPTTELEKEKGLIYVKYYNNENSNKSFPIITGKAEGGGGNGTRTLTLSNGSSRTYNKSSYQISTFYPNLGERYARNKIKKWGCEEMQ